MVTVFSRNTHNVSSGVLDTSLARILEIDIIIISTLYMKKLTQRGHTDPSGLILYRCCNKYHRFVFKQHKYIISQLRRSEVQNGLMVKIKVWEELSPFLRGPGEILFPFPFLL